MTCPTCKSDRLVIAPYEFCDGMVGVVEYGEVRECMDCGTKTRTEVQEFGWRDLLDRAAIAIRVAQRIENDDPRIQWDLRDEAIDEVIDAVHAAQSAHGKEFPKAK